MLLEQRYQVRFHLFRVTAGLVLMTGFVHLFLRSESYYVERMCRWDAVEIKSWPTIRRWILFMAR